METKDAIQIEEFDGEDAYIVGEEPPFPHEVVYLDDGKAYLTVSNTDILTTFADSNVHVYSMLMTSESNGVGHRIPKEDPIYQKVESQYFEDLQKTGELAREALEAHESLDDKL